MIAFIMKAIVPKLFAVAPWILLCGIFGYILVTLVDLSTQGGRVVRKAKKEALKRKAEERKRKRNL